LAYKLLNTYDVETFGPVVQHRASAFVVLVTNVNRTATLGNKQPVVSDAQLTFGKNRLGSPRRVVGVIFGRAG